MTFRAVETLKSCDIILAEDTRHTRILLQHFDISVISNGKRKASCRFMSFRNRLRLPRSSLMCSLPATSEALYMEIVMEWQTTGTSISAEQDP